MSRPQIVLEVNSCHYLTIWNNREFNLIWKQTQISVGLVGFIVSCAAGLAKNGALTGYGFMSYRQGWCVCR